METISRPCPIALYVGRCFAYERQRTGYQEQEIAEHLSLSRQSWEAFEKGEKCLDVLLLLKLEKIFKTNYNLYKPPVCYFGFIGYTANSQAMLYATKSAIRRTKHTFHHPKALQNIEDALLKLRYTPLRGREENS